jgi:predicted nucleotidyltransferase
MTVPFPSTAAVTRDAARLDGARCQAIADFVHAKGGRMRPSYAMLCLIYWLEREEKRPAVTAADVKTILPRLGDAVDGRLRSPADTLRRARDERLVEALGSGAYRLTALGVAVVEALPDAAHVGAIRGTQRVRCRRRALGAATPTPDAVA